MIKKIFSSVSLVFLFFTSAFAQQELASNQRLLAFTHVTVIDATGAPAQPDMTVLVSGERITALGKFGAVTVPPNAVVTNATGKFMIPGLWEMHQHTFMRKNKELPLYVLWGDIVNGVTGVRDAGDQGIPDDFGDLPYWEDFEWRQAIAAGSVIGPRLVIAGGMLEGAPSPRKGWIEIGTAAQGRAAVDSLKRKRISVVFDGVAPPERRRRVRGVIHSGSSLLIRADI